VPPSLNHDGWSKLMPIFYFNLKDAQGIHLDPEGTELPDEAHALEHGRQVAQELMQSRETRTRSWRVQVCDENRIIVFELLFATVDRTMHRFPPGMRSAIETVSARTAGLSDAIGDVRMTLHQIKGTLARSEGAPYLATLNGNRIEHLAPAAIEEERDGHNQSAADRQL